MPPMTSNFSREQDDFYRSPPGVIDALLRHVELAPGLVWEPAAGDGALVEQLTAAGRQVVASDLVDRGHPDVTPRVDFLLETMVPPGVGCIVTNPPYGLADKFVRHAVDLGVRQVVLLLRTAFMSASGPRWDLTRRVSDVVLMGRLSMLPPGAIDKGHRGEVDFAWVCFRPEPQPHQRWRNAHEGLRRRLGSSRRIA